jgi:transposase InsO family protein
MLCAKLGVTPGGYYAWVKREKSARQLENEALLIEIKRIHDESDQTYGYLRVHAALRRQGIVCGKHRVARLMRENGIIGKKAKRFKKHKHRHHIMQNSKNLLLNLEPITEKNKVWVGDITFIKVNKDWSYLSVVMDLYTRKVIGWTFNKKRSADMVTESLIMTANDNKFNADTIFHSDQGSEYASRKYTQALRSRNIRASMSRRGHCWDNAYMESFFHSMKTEMIYFNHFKTLEEATAYINNYIHFYNNKRLHSSLDYQTPAEYERIVA